VQAKKGKLTPGRIIVISGVPSLWIGVSRDKKMMSCSRYRSLFGRAIKAGVTAFAEKGPKLADATRD